MHKMPETASATPALRRVSGLAVAGFILSTTFFFSGMGMIFSAVSLARFRGYTGEEVLGRNLAFAGLVIGIVLSFLGFVLYILSFLNVPTWSPDIEELLFLLLR